MFLDFLYRSIQGRGCHNLCRSRTTFCNAGKREMRSEKKRSGVLRRCSEKLMAQAKVALASAALRFVTFSKVWKVSEGFTGDVLMCLGIDKLSAHIFSIGSQGRRAIDSSRYHVAVILVWLAILFLLHSSVLRINTSYITYTQRFI